MNLIKPANFILLVFLAIPLVCWSLPSDNDKPAYIEADQVEYQQKTGITIYLGHVKVDQGTSHLLADKMTVHRDPNSNKIQQMVAQGNPAHYSTLPKQDGKVLNASAKTIQYTPTNGIVLLLNDANILQDGNSFRAQHIEYNIIKQTVVSAPAPHSKTVIIIQPGNL